MAYWLLKTEPSAYSFEMLAKEKRTAWTGVKNAAARIHLRAMKRGDTVLIYHTGGEKAVVGIARVVKEAYPDPTVKADGNAVAVEIAAERELPKPVALAQIKADKRFAGWDLLRIGRLSVVPTTEAQFDAVDLLSRQGRS